MSSTAPGNLYQIDPTFPPGAVTTLTSQLGVSTNGITYDGQRIWTANVGLPGSVSIVTLNPINVTTVTTGFGNPIGILFDGSNIWVTDYGDNKLKELDSSGNIILSVNVGATPTHPAFDGQNIWVPNANSNTVTVVRAKGARIGTVLAMLSGNGLNAPNYAAFDGERILVTNLNGNSVSLWSASDLTPISNIPTGNSTKPLGVCSDGINFWVTFNFGHKLARF